MAQSNGYITTNCVYDEEDKPMLLMKKSIDSQGNGLTALINKQLQGESDRCCLPKRSQSNIQMDVFAIS